MTAKLDRLIMRALECCGKSGMICQLIEVRIGRSHQAVSGNLRHLAERRLVMKTKLRGKTTSGRRAIKWVALRHYDAAIHSDELPPRETPAQAELWGCLCSARTAS